MRSLVYLCFVLTLLVSCGESTENYTAPDTVVSNQSPASQNDSVSIEQLEELSLNPFDSLMEYPIDLQEFKRVKRGALNGAGGPPDFRMKPNQNGFYYCFKLFTKRPPHINEGDYLQGLVLTVYRFGEDIGYYSDTNEVFIGIKSRFQDEDLGSLNIVGQTLKEVQKNFSGKAIVDNELVLIPSRHNLLVLHMKEGRVEWFNYVKLGFELTAMEQLPDQLKRF